MRLRHIISVFVFAVAAASLSYTPALGAEQKSRKASTTRTASKPSVSSKKSRGKKRIKTNRTANASKAVREGHVFTKRSVILESDGSRGLIEVMADGVMLSKQNGTRQFYPTTASPIKFKTPEGTITSIQYAGRTIIIYDDNGDETIRTILAPEGDTNIYNTTVEQLKNGTVTFSRSTSSSSLPSVESGSSYSTSFSSSGYDSSSYSYSYSYSDGYDDYGKNVDTNIYMYLPEDDHGDFYLPELNVSKSNPYSTCMRRLAYSSGGPTEVNVYFMTNRRATIKSASLHLGKQTYSPVSFKDITLEPNSGTPEYIPCLSFKFDTGYHTDEPGKNDKLVLTMQDGTKVTTPLVWPSSSVTTRTKTDSRNSRRQNGTVPPRDPMSDD